MSSLESQPITVKELREAYDLFPKEKLIDILIERTLTIRKLREEKIKLTMKL